MQRVQYPTMDPWYKNAIIYAVDVARFADGNGDGVGDFAGLTEKLPYISALGITCIWLLPFYPSPGRDNGYDVSDYYGVNPALGTLDDFMNFLHRAGEYGIQVMVDLVVNHTSDMHPWFKAARHDESSGFRSWYVWTDQPPPLDPGAKTMFPGPETSVWTYDEIARAYYYHQFYHFEPNLNVVNPEVQAEVQRIMDFWLSLGVAGFRLDAAAPMIREKGLASTRPTDPHGILRGFYDFLIARRPSAAMLGEVDVEPEMLQSFFREGGQLNLLLNFVLNNYLFLALATRSADPIRRAMRMLPKLPEHGQWATFIRNLDELDLERLTPEERVVVMDAFAPDEDMRIYGRGIRRRLAPMLDGNQRWIELCFSLLCSLPGAPLIVYGDEIGMGEDLKRPGRDAVRAPMQWSAEANAGFSKAPEARLMQPVIRSGPFACRHVNVADQEGREDSLLSAVKRLIRLRRQHRAIGEAVWIPLEVGDPGVLAHGYNTGSSFLFMLHNFTAEAKTVTLDLGARRPPRLEDLIDETERLIDGGGVIDLPPYGYRWLLQQGLR